MQKLSKKVEDNDIELMEYEITSILMKRFTQASGSGSGSGNNVTQTGQNQSGPNFNLNIPYSLSFSSQQ